jgi:death-on-curing protein
VRYLSLAEALTVAEVVTGLDALTLARMSRLDLLDSALHAPQAGFGDEDFYPDFGDKAAVLVVRITRNHALVDGNKRLAWAALNMFVSLNRRTLEVRPDEAVETMLRIAGGDLGDEAVSAWLGSHIGGPAD